MLELLMHPGEGSFASCDLYENHNSFSHHRELKQQTNFSQYIWDNAIDLLPQARNTTFISGVLHGDLNPNFYGDYVLQDSIYCRIVAQLWTELANYEAADEEVRAYANDSISGFQDCSVQLFDRWSIKDDGEDSYGVLVEDPVKEYTTYINETMIAYPPNALIATYACLKLWNNLTNELWEIVKDETSNPYRVWVNENRDDGSSARRQATQMDEWDSKYQWYDWSEGLSLFRSAMMNEINFFNHAGNSSKYLSV
ncbi:hypothetical protein KP509_26G003800 [Ceratopteris richardii]|nr:hypothetical protein KP509_26G003800 [Ceratopteris richardii]